MGTSRGLALLVALLVAAPVPATEVDLGPRPAALVQAMDAGALKDRLLACLDQPARPARFSIGHRGAPLMYPEHTRESYEAAARMGAGIIECDVTFTKDRVLVCRHAQDDLAETTDILATDLAARCVQPFRPAAGGVQAAATCRTSDLTVDEFRRLRGRMAGVDRHATTLAGYMDGMPAWRTDRLGAAGGTLLTHAESIRLGLDLGVMFMPELKAPAVPMPFDGYTQADYARALVDEYRAAGVPPSQVWLQSFSLADVRWWIEHAPEFGRQAVWLDGRYGEPGFDPLRPDTLSPTMTELAAMGVRHLAPPLWVLLAVEDGRIVPSPYARAARAAGLRLVTWTLERSGPLAGGGGWYFRSVAPLVDDDGDVFTVLDVLAREVGVAGVFSDWPATVTFYANCLGLD